MALLIRRDIFFLKCFYYLVKLKYILLENRIYYVLFFLVREMRLLVDYIDINFLL